MSWVLGADLEIEKLWYDPLANLDAPTNTNPNLTNEDSTIQRYVPESKIRNAGKIFKPEGQIDISNPDSIINNRTFSIQSDTDIAFAGSGTVVLSNKDLGTVIRVDDEKNYSRWIFCINSKYYT